ncbi:MAG: Fe-S protein assembly co-chaperone HscB [Burkholderiaceae bacterium]|nr:Fe-S protein assembly co-chaperone HscB [Burkholderiaceae bacterium]
MALKNYFELLNQPQTFAVDSLSLENAYQTLMARFHPDRFVNAPIVEKRVAEQVSVRINEAYQTIKAPLARAQYLCSLKGLNVQERRPMPPAVLMKQMDWHEMLEAALATGDDGRMYDLKEEVTNERQMLLTQLQDAFDVKKDDAMALELTRELMFVEKLLLNIQR